MHSFIIDQLPPKVSSSPDILIIEPETSIGIEQVRQIQSFLSRKPVQSDKNVVYLISAHLLTLPAQHAILKTLEEPPANSEIYLVTEFTDQLLPTILSRVQIKTNKITKGSPDLTKSRQLLEKLLRAKVGERLNILEAESFTRESFTTFIDELEWILHGNLNLIDYQVLVQTRKYLKANCNLKLCLVFLSSKLIPID